MFRSFREFQKLLFPGAGSEILAKLGAVGE